MAVPVYFISALSVCMIPVTRTWGTVLLSVGRRWGISNCWGV